MGKIIAITNLKGGVGKTTSAVNLSAALGALEQRVLLIDADPQANATLAIGYQTTSKSFYDFLKNNSSEKIIIRPSKYFEFIPSNAKLSKLEFIEFTTAFTNYNWNKIIELKSNYDYVIIDCPPNLSHILINILIISDSVIIPVQCEYFAFHGLRKLFKTLQKIREQSNPSLDIDGILITMFNKSFTEHRHINNCIREQFQFLVFNTIISQNIKLSEASSVGKSLIEYDANSSGANSYLKLADEIISKNLKKQDRYLNINNLTIENNEDVINDLDFIFNINEVKLASKKSESTPNFDNLIGLSKKEVKDKLGQVFNDINSDIWTYRLSEKFSFLKKNYLYLYFKNDLVVVYFQKTFKVNPYKKEFDLTRYIKDQLNELKE